MQWARVDVNVSQMDADLGEVPLRDTVRISGSVVSDNGAAPATRGALRLVLTPATNGPAAPIAFSVPRAGFEIHGVIPGRYFVRVDSQVPGLWLESLTVDGASALDGPVDIGPDGASMVVALTSRPTRLRGAVRNSRRLPVPGAKVLVLPVDSSGQAVWAPNRTRETRASAWGVFTVDGLPPGDYLVVSIDDADAEGWQDPAVLARLRRLAVRVTIAAGDEKALDLELKVV
jgi:hypothetical protein